MKTTKKSTSKEDQKTIENKMIERFEEMEKEFGCIKKDLNDVKNVMGELGKAFDEFKKAYDCLTDEEKKQFSADYNKGLNSKKFDVITTDGFGKTATETFNDRIEARCVYNTVIIDKDPAKARENGTFVKREFKERVV